MFAYDKNHVRLHPPSLVGLLAPLWRRLYLSQVIQLTDAIHRGPLRRTKEEILSKSCSLGPILWTILTSDGVLEMWSFPTAEAETDMLGIKAVFFSTNRTVP